jgi:alpha-tubulin suppressor-like RCC1 family protein
MHAHARTRTHAHSHTPRAHTLPGVSAVAIALGEAHACLIASGGGVKCWGDNKHGQLGIGNTVDATQPTDVAGARTHPPRTNIHTHKNIYIYI